MARYRITIAALGAALLALSAAVAAAPTGLAYDSVTKLAMNADAASQQPGDFNSDFAAAAAVQAPEQSSGGGIFGQIRQAAALGKSMEQMMRTGFAERTYVAGSKERVDNLSMQTATITDCAARTVTTLDLRRKTYKTVSMDQPSSPTGGGGNASPGAMHDNGTRVAITVTNTALGSRNVGGQPTSGYRSDMTITETNNSGESHTQNGNMVAYYSNYASPVPSCSRFGGPAAQIRSPMMANYAQLMHALAAAGLDKRFSIKQSGPPMPLGKLAMFSAVTFAGQGGGVTFASERGNVRSISPSDPAFTIPADFTPQQ